MDRAIFNLEASVEATSLYILLSALEEQDEPLTLDRAGVRWNGTREDLLKAAEELMQRGVIEVEGGQPLARDRQLLVNRSEAWH